MKKNNIKLNRKKRCRKKIIFRILILLFILKSKIFAYSDNFNFIIDTIGIPRINSIGESINEEIYNIYKVFVYSSPTNVASKTSLQRFKYVENKGKWKEEKTGLNGEYYILGTDYNGNLVTNVYFPVDFLPETEPINWNYLYNEGAINTWNDFSKYKYLEQLEYMKNSNIQFDKIDFENNICDSYNLVEYNINAQTIGLEKAFLETCATWTTSGVINVKRITNDGQIRYATFFVKPMAASAQIKSTLKLDEKSNIERIYKDGIITIKFGAEAINLNDYAKEKHIKEINSDIYINGKKIDTIKSTKTKFIEKEIQYKIPESILKSNLKILDIKVKSYLYTEFSVDGLLQDTIQRNITIPEYVSKENKVPASSMLVKILEKDDNEFIVKEFLKTNNTQNCNSLGIVEKGKYIAIKISNINVDTVDNLQVYINNRVYKKEIISLDNIDNNVILKVKVIENSKDEVLNTIATWKYLKEISNNYYKVDFSKIGTRIKEPNVLKIYAGDKIFTEKFDVIDEYIYNMNYIFKNNIINKNNYIKKVRLSEWIK